LTILSLDTSSAGGSAAIVRDGEIVIERAGDRTRMHGERLPGELMALLDAAKLTLNEVQAYAVSIGPGSFTGLRVGIAAIQGLALAQGKMVTPVSSFEALAFPLLGTNPVAVWIDAHRGEVFATLLAPTGDTIHEPTSMTPAATLDAWTRWIDNDAPIAFAGDGAIAYRDTIRSRFGDRTTIAEPRLLAGTIGLIAAAHPGRAVQPHAIAPLYVRRPDAVLARERQVNRA
jgi:tRNA threonylcarbamoyladenosine biosynthesis protein TsaB